MSGWRDWVEEMKDMAESMAVRLRDDRPLTPFFIYSKADAPEPEAVPLSREHFERDRLGMLVNAFVIPLVRMHGAERCAWMFNAKVAYFRADESVEIPECIILSLFDSEIEETWAAPIFRYSDGTAIGIWRGWPANETRSQLVLPVQSAIR